MKKLFPLLLLLTALLFQCLPAQEKPNRAGYPAWFLYPPLDDHQIFATGICQPCLYNDSSVALAKTDACWKIVNMSGVRIKSQSGISGPTPRIAHMGQNISFETDSSHYEPIADQDTVIEKYYSGNMLIILVGPKKFADSSINYLVRDYGQWWTDIPNDNEYFYALGSTPKYYYESSSWDIALNNALIELTRQISLQVKSLVKYDGQTVEKSFIEEGDVVLKDWRIIARHYSPDNQTYHVLIRMPK